MWLNGDKPCAPFPLKLTPIVEDRLCPILADFFQPTPFAFPHFNPWKENHGGLKEGIWYFPIDWTGNKIIGWINCFLSFSVWSPDLQCLNSPCKTLWKHWKDCARSDFDFEDTWREEFVMCDVREWWDKKWTKIWRPYRSSEHWWIFPSQPHWIYFLE